ncbi:MAG TPA: hypothetical protein VHT91_10490 [Kofleriaceae bacterium]|jgi:hypothetical protein|nr:hypothetical protein [Kofleriaceae bacterium]
MTDSTRRPDERSTERIEAALAQLGAEHEPPVGWEARVMAAVGASRRRWWVYAVPAGVALAAAAAVAVVVLQPPPELALNVDIKHSARYRGDEPSAGDTAHIVVSGGKGSRAIWVYHEEVQLVLRCPGDPKCRISDASTEVDVKLSSAGAYTVVALTGGASLPALSGSYDADTAAAKDAGLDVRQSRLVVQ